MLTTRGAYDFLCEEIRRRTRVHGGVGSTRGSMGIVGVITCLGTRYFQRHVRSYYNLVGNCGNSSKAFGYSDRGRSYRALQRQSKHLRCATSPRCTCLVPISGWSWKYFLICCCTSSSITRSTAGCDYLLLACFPHHYKWKERSTCYGRCCTAMALQPLQTSHLETGSLISQYWL